MKKWYFTAEVMLIYQYTGQLKAEEFQFLISGFLESSENEEFPIEHVQEKVAVIFNKSQTQKIEQIKNFHVLNQVTVRKDLPEENLEHCTQIHKTRLY